MMCNVLKLQTLKDILGTVDLDNVIESAFSSVCPYADFADEANRPFQME